MSENAHRPGLFKLPQKKHSVGRHRSKRAITRDNKGKLSVKDNTKLKIRECRKLERRNKLAQIRTNKAAKLLEMGRIDGGAPIIITVLSLDHNYGSVKIVELLCSADDDAIVNKNEAGNVVHLAVPRFKTRYIFLFPETNRVVDVQDCLRVSDLLILYWQLNTETLETNHQQLLNTILAQGTPETLNIVTGMPSSGKKRDSMRKMLEKTMTSWTKEFARIHNLDHNNDALQLLRHISTMKKSHSNIQRTRPYLLAECIKVTTESDKSNSLHISGYLHGTPLNVNHLVHVPGFGDFQMEKIICHADPYPIKRFMTDIEENIITADQSKQIPLDTEITPDPMDSEQPALNDEEKFIKPKVKKRVPKGTSEYQASWLIDDDDDEEKNSEDESLQENDSESEVNNTRFDEQMEEESSDDASNNEDEDMQSEVLSASSMNLNEIDSAEKDAMDKTQLERFRQERENCQWPDEIETAHGMNARERFQRYRGLKSFRTSYWDPKENLPPEYARIYKMYDFKRTRKLALSEAIQLFEKEDNGEYAFPGTFLTITIKDIPSHLCEDLKPNTYMSVFGLLRHEHRMSVLNMVLQKHPSCNFPIKNKDNLLFQVGYRRFTANPIFSQHTNGNKFKMERFMPNSGAFCATTFAPIIYPPCNVTVFREIGKSLQLVASGIVLDINTDRIILKRTVLSGHPYRVNKRTAVVRYMFFNREDIEWFKPVELYTQSGRHGRIKQTLGTHGLMKCTFDHPLSVQDSVLMNLYKRVFPKWEYNSQIGIGHNFTITEVEDLNEEEKILGKKEKKVHFGTNDEFMEDE